jgi:lactoylglutathione lyase
MRTLQVALRVRDRATAVAFYTALGYETVGEVPDSPIGHLTMLKLPGDDFVTVELVHDPTQPPILGSSLSHLAIQVESLDAALDRIRRVGIDVESVDTPGPDLHTASITDPDGHRVELVQAPRTPRGHDVSRLARWTWALRSGPSTSARLRRSRRPSRRCRRGCCPRRR